MNSVYTNNVAGDVIQSQQSTSLAINGNGFFVVKAPPATNATGSTQTFAGTITIYTVHGNINGTIVNITSVAPGCASTLATSVPYPPSKRLNCRLNHPS